MGIVSNGLRAIEDVCPLSQSGTLRKKIVSTKKAYKIDSVAFAWNAGASIFKSNDLYELKRNTKDLSSCLICYQFHWKVLEFFIFGIYFRASIAFERYRSYSGGRCDWKYKDLFGHVLIFCIMNFSKIDRFLCFTRKVTLQGQINVFG